MSLGTTTATVDIVVSMLLEITRYQSWKFLEQSLVSRINFTLSAFELKKLDHRLNLAVMEVFNTDFGDLIVVGER